MTISRTQGMSGRTLAGTAALLTVLAWLTAVAALLVAFVLVIHQTQHCGIAVGGDTYCDSRRHPLAPVGIGVGVGGLLMAALLAGVGRIAMAVGTLCDRRDD